MMNGAEAAADAGAGAGADVVAGDAAAAAAHGGDADSGAAVDGGYVQTNDDGVAAAVTVGVVVPVLLHKIAGHTTHFARSETVLGAGRSARCGATIVMIVMKNSTAHCALEVRAWEAAGCHTMPEKIENSHDNHRTAGRGTVRRQT